MAWNLDSAELKTYSRNPLSLVVAQLKFHQILAISIDGKVPAIQDQLRVDYPLFELKPSRTFQFGPIPLEVDKDEFHFTSENRTASVTLTNTSIALTHHDHLEREEFIGRFSRAVGSLLDVCGSVAPTRLGLRYINEIDKETIGETLDRSVEWSDLIKPDFLKIPGELADLEGLSFTNTIRAPISRGEMTLRMGLQTHPDTGVVKYRFDVDRFARDNIDPTGCSELLDEFATDIYNAFMAAVGPSLLDWMNHSEDGGEG